MRWMLRGAWTTSSAWCLQWIGFFYREKKLQLLWTYCSCGMQKLMLVRGLLRSKIGLFQFNPEIPLPAACQRWHQKAIRCGVDWNFKPWTVRNANGRRLHREKLSYCQNDSPMYSCAKNWPEMARILPTVVDKWSAQKSLTICLHVKKSAANAGSMVYEFSGHDRRVHNLRQFFLHDAWMQIYMHAWYTGKIDWIGSMNFKDRSFTRFTTIVGEDQSYIYDNMIFDRLTQLQ